MEKETIEPMETKEIIETNVLLKDVLIYDYLSEQKHVNIKDHVYYKALKKNDSKIYLKYVKKMCRQKQKDTGTWYGFIELYNNIKTHGINLENTGSIVIKKTEDDKYCCFHGRHRICMMKYLYSGNTVLTLKNNRVFNITHV
jgi:hypothetical protein